MVFTEYMANLPNQKQEMIERLAKKTQTSKCVVYRWISGKVIPPPLKRTIIAQELGKTVEELFPSCYGRS